jgi:hypothetical protein
MSSRSLPFTQEKKGVPKSKTRKDILLKEILRQDKVTYYA